jgi:hypothetical protein
MTEEFLQPKDKAREIYCRFSEILNIRDLRTCSNPFVKSCCIYLCDEVITDLERESSDDSQSAMYWNEVKLFLEEI